MILLKKKANEIAIIIGQYIEITNKYYNETSQNNKTLFSSETATTSTNNNSSSINF